MPTSPSFFLVILAAPILVLHPSTVSALNDTSSDDDTSFPSGHLALLLVSVSLLAGHIIWLAYLTLFHLQPARNNKKSSTVCPKKRLPRKVLFCMDMLCFLVNPFGWITLVLLAISDSNGASGLILWQDKEDKQATTSAEGFNPSSAQATPRPPKDESLLCNLQNPVTADGGKPKLSCQHDLTLSGHFWNTAASSRIVDQHGDNLCIGGVTLEVPKEALCAWVQLRLIVRETLKGQQLPEGMNALGPLIQVYPLKSYHASIPLYLTIKLNWSPSEKGTVAVFHSATSVTQPCVWKPLTDYQLLGKDSLRISFCKGGTFVIFEKVKQITEALRNAIVQEILCALQPRPVWLAVRRRDYLGGESGVTIQMTCLYQETFTFDGTEQYASILLQPQRIGYFYPGDYIHIKLNLLAESTHLPTEGVECSSPQPMIENDFRLSSQSPRLVTEAIYARSVSSVSQYSKAMAIVSPVCDPSHSSTTQTDYSIQSVRFASADYVFPLIPEENSL